jgi:hypothetical protein
VKDTAPRASQPVELDGSASTTPSWSAPGSLTDDAQASRPDPAPRGRGADTSASQRDQYEIHFTRPDGSEVWGRVNSTLLAETTGGPSLVLTQIEDITMLRTMQARFAYAATRLARSAW